MEDTGLARAIGLGAAVALLTALLLTTSCTKSKGVSLGQGDSGSQVEVKQGQPVTVELPSDSKRGFGWFVSDPGPLEQTGEGAADGKPKTKVTGSAEMQTFTFNAPNPGSGELAIEYRALHGGSAPDSRKWSAEVTVK